MDLPKTKREIEPKLYILIYICKPAQKTHQHIGAYHSLEEAKVDAQQHLPPNMQWEPVQDIWVSAEKIEHLFLQCSTRTWQHATRN